MPQEHEGARRRAPKRERRFPGSERNRLIRPRRAEGSEVAAGTRWLAPTQTIARERDPHCSQWRVPTD